MKFEIDLTKVHANIAGELLRNYVVSSNPEQYFGYDTFETSPTFKEVDDVPSLFIRTLCCGSFAKDKAEYSRINHWVSDRYNMDVYLYWDGDGTLIFDCHDSELLLYTGDCKKAHEWTTNVEWAIDYPFEENSYV